MRLASSLFGVQIFFRQPATDREVVEPHAQPGQQDTSGNEDDGLGPGLADGQHRSFPVEADMDVEEVHERIMYRIKRIGEVADKPAYAAGRLADGQLGCPHPYQGREDEQYAKCIVSPSEPRHRLRADDREEGHYQKNRPTFPERSLNLHRLEDARHEHSHRVGEQHAYQSAPEPMIGQGPADAQLSLAYGDIGQDQARYGSDAAQYLRAGSPEQQGIEDVADILEEE